MIKFKGYNYTNNGYYEKYYEEKAAEGYFIKKMYLRFIHVFERDNPKKIKYKFEYHKNNSIFDKYEKQERKDFIEQSQNLGWKHILKTFNYHLFCDESYNKAQELSIDNKEEIKQVMTSLYLNIIPIFSFFIIFFLGLENLKMSNRFFEGNIDIIKKNNLMFITTCFVYGSFFIDSIDMLIFYFKNKNNFTDKIKYNIPILSTISKVFSLLGIVLLLYILIFLGLN